MRRQVFYYFMYFDIIKGQCVLTGFRMLHPQELNYPIMT